ncbi:MAG: ATP synthase F0 subunit B [Actinomycetota bacterium]
MLTAVSISVGLLQADKEAPANDLNPIALELKEFAWGMGAFAVLALAIRYWLFPKIRDGMQARADLIQGDKESAETMTAAARADVAEYEARLASVRAEAQGKIDAARETLESERTEKISAVNERIAQQRAEAAAAVEEARQAAMDDVESAVVDVVGRAAEIALGQPASADAVRSAVRSSMGATAGTGGS